MVDELTIDSSVEEIEERRAAIASQQAKLQAEHRKLGSLLAAKGVDIGAMKAEHEKLGNIIKVTEMSMKGKIEVGNDG